MKIAPDPGFGQPCCPQCAEFNAQGCPGNSGHCITDWYAALDYQTRKIQEAVEMLVLSLEPHLPTTGALDARVANAAEQALAGLERMRALADECNSDARGRRVA